MNKEKIYEMLIKYDEFQKLISSKINDSSVVKQKDENNNILFHFEDWIVFYHDLYCNAFNLKTNEPVGFFTSFNEGYKMIHLSAFYKWVIFNQTFLNDAFTENMFKSGLKEIISELQNDKKLIFKTENTLNPGILIV